MLNSNNVGGKKFVRGIKSSLRKYRILGIGVLSILIIQMLFSFVPIPSIYGTPPQPSNQPVSVTKTYTANQLGTQIQTTITFRAELNGTITFSKNDVESFRILLPSGLDGTTTLLKNETYAIIDVSNGAYFIQEKWKLNAINFKLELCWNLPTPTTIGLPLNRFAQTSNSTFHIGGLLFDWKDAIMQGYSPSFENSTNSIKVPVPADGCLDPTITTTTEGDQKLPSFPQIGATYSQGRWWVVSCEDLDRVRVRSSTDGTTWTTGNTLDISQDCDNLSVFFDGNHIHLANADSSRDSHFHYKRFNYTASGTITNDTDTSLDTAGGSNPIRYRNPMVALNSTGYPVVCSGHQEGSAGNHYVRYWQSLDIKGTNWYSPKLVFQDASDNSGPPSPSCSVQSIGSGNVRIVYSPRAGTSMSSKIYYIGNHTVGSATTISSTLRSNGAFSSASTSDGATHIAYMDTGGYNPIKYRNISSTNSLGAAQTISGTSAGGDGVKIALGSNNNTVVVAWVNTTLDNLYARTSTTGMTFNTQTNVAIAITASTNFQISYLPLATSEWGLITVTGTSSPWSITFSTFISPTWGTDVPVAFSSQFEREPHIAVSPKTNTLVTGYFSGNGTSTSRERCAVRTSNDGGVSWTFYREIGTIGGIEVGQKDPVVAVNSTGHFTLVCVQSLNQTDSNDHSYIFVSSSNKTGMDWTSPRMINDSTFPNIVHKPWIAIDNQPLSDYRNNTYLCWSRYSKGIFGIGAYEQIVFKKIYPVGEPAKVLYGVSGSNANKTLVGCNMAIGPAKGEVYVFWLNIYSSTQGSIEYTWNNMGGNSTAWKAVATLANLTRVPPDKPACGVDSQGCLNGTDSKFRAGTDPSVGVDGLGGVHVSYVDWVSNNAEIKYRNSANCNRLNTTCTWNPIITINTDGTSRDQWEPIIHVSNITSGTNPRGIIHITALDKRDDSANQKWKVYHYYCRSPVALGCTNTSDWTNELVSDELIHNNGQKHIGEYHGLTNTKTKEAYTVWVARRNPFPSYGFDIYADWEYR